MPSARLANRVRRQVEMCLDQAWALPHKRLGRRGAFEPFDGDPRFALVTVNFSTTHYLKLLLLTLCDQDSLDLISRIVIVDNGSRDGGLPFLRDLSTRADRLHVVENRHFLNHARGMRRGIAELEQVEADVSRSERSNLLLFCDTDVIFLNPEAMLDLAASVVAHDAALAGELRRLHPYPDVQASFFVARRDVYARRDVRPWVHHGSPAYWLQRSIWQAGLTVVDFPSNHGGHVLHRGRTGVAAARAHAPLHAYARVEAGGPHYMGVPDGERLWAEVEDRHARLLAADHESELVVHLVRQLERRGT